MASSSLSVPLDPPLTRASRRPRSLGQPPGWVGWLLPALALALWELLSRLGILPPHWFPAPTRVFRVLWALGESGHLLRHVGATLLRVGLGFCGGATLGTALGIGTGRSRRLHALLDPALQALRSIPSLAWVRKEEP